VAIIIIMRNNATKNPTGGLGEEIIITIISVNSLLITSIKYWNQQWDYSTK
jgi:hypothetical protein